MGLLWGDTIVNAPRADRGGLVRVDPLNQRRVEAGKPVAVLRDALSQFGVHLIGNIGLALTGAIPCGRRWAIVAQMEEQFVEAPEQGLEFPQLGPELIGRVQCRQSPTLTLSMPFLCK